MNNWIQTLASLRQQATPCVMVTVASTIGSTPRESGARMIVTEQDLYGTIGGGNLEFQACAIARQLLESREPQQLRRFPLGAGLGQCCGGLVNLLFEPIVDDCEWIQIALDYDQQKQPWLREVPISEASVRVRACENEVIRLTSSHFIDVKRSNSIELTLFGAGHVGRAIVEAMRALPVTIRWIDSRDSEFPDNYATNVEVIVTDTPEAEVDSAVADSYFLVMTHHHGLDQTLSEAILKRNDFAYFGLIGSAGKRRMFETRMRRRGIDATKIERMTCPIGIDGINNKQPAMIAISVVAQIMQVYDQRSSSKQKEHNLSSKQGRG